MLVREKEVTRARDALAAERRRMPWMEVEKDYRFEGPCGEMTLADLFEGRRQLVVYRAFYGPDVTTYAEGGSYPERACVGCSFIADQIAHPAHLNARGVTLAFASRAPQSEIQGLRSVTAGSASPGTRSPTTSTRTSGSTNGTGTTPSSATATGSSARISSTPAATSTWARPGAIST